MKSALLIIDVQQALCNGEWAAFDIERVIARINAVVTQARAAGAPIIWIQHEESEGPLQFRSDGWQLDRRLAVGPDDVRLRKTACDSFHRTELQPLLQAHGVGRVIVCGLQSEFCVDSTVRGALARGYPVSLIADAHTTVDNGVLSAAQISAHHTTTLANLSSFGPGVSPVAAAELSFGA
jgi:nicotinamidase-related amidase